MGKASRRLPNGLGGDVGLVVQHYSRRDHRWVDADVENGVGESIRSGTHRGPIRKGFCDLSTRQSGFVGVRRSCRQVVGHARTVETHHEKFDLTDSQTRSNVDNQSGFCDVPLRCPHVRSDAALADQRDRGFFVQVNGVAHKHLSTFKRKRLLLASRWPRPGEDVHGGRERSPRQIYTKKSLGTLQSLHTREVVAVEKGGSGLRARCQCVRCRKAPGANAWILHTTGRVRRWFSIHFDLANLQVSTGACWLFDPNGMAQAGTVTEESEGSLSG
mmetsp:Transcript_19626/g.74226  ORF Transcript_19626/g.74226 Transcript_19626/m.74226 type:complete len:273 (-) Transcript_19626:6888-7706(-)